MNLKANNSPSLLLYHRSRLQPKNIVETPNKAEVFKQSLKTVGKEYCLESSISGLKYLASEDTPFIERIIWVITLIGALVCSVSLVWVTFDSYYRAPLVTTQMPEGIPVSEIVFPAIGICSNNRMSKRAVTEFAQKLLKEERNKQFNESEMLTMLFGLGQFYTINWSYDHVVPPMRLHQILGDYDIKEIMRNLTPKCEDLQLRCAWNEEIRNCTDLFDFRLTMNGYCCTFNYLRSSDVFEDKKADSRNVDMYKSGNQSTFDFDTGLLVLLRLNESDDFFYNIPLQGAQLQFSDAYDFPDAPSGSFAMQIISPSVQMVVMVAATFTSASRDIQHVDVKLRQCLFYDESKYLPFYTSSDCMLKCRLEFLLQKCNCSPFNMPTMLNNRTCDFRDLPCLRKYNGQSITVRPRVEQVPDELELDMVDGGIPCPMCYPTCSKTTYSYDFINIKIYPDELNKIPDSSRDIWLHGLLHGHYKIHYLKDHAWLAVIRFGGFGPLFVSAVNY